MNRTFKVHNVSQWPNLRLMAESLTVQFSLISRHRMPHSTHATNKFTESCTTQWVTSLFDLDLR